LQEAIARARINQRSLFKNYQVYISSGIEGHAMLQRIIETNGGEARIVSSAIKGRAKIIRPEYLRTVDQILVCADKEKTLQEKFQDEVNERGLTSEMYSTEWITRSVLRQEIVDDDGIALLP
jgi:hypothetical protein